MIFSKGNKLAIFIFSIANLWGVNFQDFDAYQNTFSREQIENKIKSYLTTDPKAAEFYRLTSDELYIGNLAEQKIDYVLHLATTAKPLTKKVSPTLRGAKIAIDPGHFGGVFAKLEDRYVAISAEEAETDRPVAFDEGTLAYLTAVELRSLLQAEGAEVMITRSGIGQGAIKETFFEWLQNRPAVWESKEPLVRLFRDHYNRADLVARAEKINAFAPDITIIIHYNAADSASEKTRLSQENYSLAFIPGAFCAGELNKTEDRYEFLRLILTDHLEQSLQLSQKVVNQFARQLKVPLATQDPKNTPLEKACLLQLPGIYSRNLALTRLVHSPLCYGESLIQNNKQEVRRLATNDIEIAGIPCPSRVREVAQAYFEGIKSYFENR